MEGLRTFDRVPYCVEFFCRGVGGWFAAKAVDDEGIQVYHFFMIVVGFDDGLTGYAGGEGRDSGKDAGFRHDGLSEFCILRSRTLSSQISKRIAQGDK